MDELQDVEGGESTEGGERETHTRKRRYIRPAVDIYSTSDETVVLADMPGVHKTDLDVRVEGDDLLIEARAAGRMEEESALPWGYHRRFRLRSAFDRDRIAADYEDGILRVTLPKLSAEDTRKIEIS